MAQYKYNALATETVTWVSQSGVAIEVVVTLKEEQVDYFGNGEFVRTRDGLSIEMTNVVGGAKDCGVWIKPAPSGLPAGIVAVIGKVGLTAERKDEIEAAYSKVEDHPEWTAMQKARKQGMDADRAYEAHVKAVDKMMTLGGKTF
jgi:hypothetical protein